jgi:DmsE family decaheme c-type cytochrome
MKPRNLSQAAPGVLLAMSMVFLLVLPTGALGHEHGNYVGTQSCLDCHDDMATDYARSLHGRLQDHQYPGKGEGCESCHGPGGAHADSEDPADIYLPIADMGNAGVSHCLDCHKTGTTHNWEFSDHAESDVACLSCHKIHGNPRKALLADCEQKVCFSCHTDMKAKFQMPSHHPLREGFMTCSSCHDAHGNRYQNVADSETTRAACLSCHTEHAGPYIFEHSPVEEDCGICHDVHGAVANNLLKQNEPFICLQCHQPHFHSILAGYEGEYGVGASPPPPNSTDLADDDPGYGGLSGVSHYDSMKRSMLTKCTQCHQSIHGTDLPSQGISGQGRALNR